MALPFTDQKFSPHRLRKLIIGTALVIAAIVGANAIVIAQLHLSTLREVQDDLLRQSLTLSELIEAPPQSVDLVLSSVADRVRADSSTSSDLQQLTDQEHYSFLKEKKSELPQIASLAILDANGKKLNHSRDWPSPNNDLSSREYFQELKANPNITSFVSKPVQGSTTGEWVVVLGRPALSKDGQFLGVIVASTVINYFEDLFRSTSFGDGYAASLMRQDETLLARYPVAETIGKVIPATILGKLADSRSGAFRGISPIDNQPRIVAAYRLSNYPLAVVVTQTERAAFAPWRKAMLTVGLITFVMIVVIVIAAYLIARSWKQRDRLNAARAEIIESDKVRALAEVELSRQRDLAEQSMRLHAALENMTQGLCMFDTDSRLVVCNE